MSPATAGGPLPSPFARLGRAGARAGDDSPHLPALPRSWGPGHLGAPLPSAPAAPEPEPAWWRTRVGRHLLFY